MRSLGISNYQALILTLMYRLKPPKFKFEVELVRKLIKAYYSEEGFHQSPVNSSLIVDSVVNPSQDHLTHLSGLAPSVSSQFPVIS